MEENGIDWWHTPPETPDLNPIKNLWHELKLYLELVDGIKKFWAEKVTEEKCVKYIVHILKKVVPAVVEACGAATQY